MKQRPILFSTPMVQAILEGRKTQTRRVVKHELDDRGFKTTNNIYEDWHGKEVKCPYGQVGDVLWVREAYAPHYFDDFSHGYKANWNDTAAEYVNQPKWKPSIYMPKEACRIWLKISNIRVQRLQDISEDDALAEGIREFTKDGVGFKYGLEGWSWSYGGGFPCMCYNRKYAFELLWQSINGQDSWEANPWVWVIEFERIAKPNEA